MTDLATVVLGDKDRVELEECLAAEAAGPLSDGEMGEVEATAPAGPGLRGPGPSAPPQRSR